MEKRLIHLHSSGDIKQLIQEVKAIPDGDLKQVITSRFLKGREDAVAVVRALLTGSPVTYSDNIKRRLAIFKHCIKLLQGNDLTSKMASELVGSLMLETDSFPADCLAELAAKFVDSIKSGIGTSGKSLELFPKVLSALAAQESVKYDGREMSGTEYKGHVLNSLCAGRWDPSTVIHLAAMFRDVPLSAEELRFVTDKMLRMFPDLELQELPPLVYQLLLLSTKGHKKAILDGMIMFFAEKDRIHKMECKKEKEDSELDIVTTGNQLQHVEGTIILHMTFAIKQDQDLGREVIKFLKSAQQRNVATVLAPFSIALALSIARIHRFEEQIYDLLKVCVVKSYKDAVRQQESCWVREMAPESSEVADLLLDTVHNSVHGWDHVTQGLVQLGFTLMDAFGPKGVFGKVVECPAVGQKSPTQKACQLGARVLLETFRVHDFVRPEILEQILNRVVTKATTQVSHYLDLLSSTVSCDPQALLESVSKVREAFDYLSYLPPATAEGLMKAVQPLLKLSMALKDSLVLVLKKAMFSKNLEARQIAVSGFLLMLRNFRVLGGLQSSQPSQSLLSCSQVQVDVHLPYNTSTNESLCLEIIGNLRRCLSQQAGVRLTLYEGLYDVMCRNSQLQQPIIQVLTSQLMGYYEKDPETQPPLKLEPCIQMQGENVFTREPLGHLLLCLVQCHLKVIQAQSQREDDEDEDEDVSSEVADVLEQLTKRMISSELEDFELDKSSDFSESGVGTRNNILAILLLHTYEVLILYSFQSANYEVAACDRVLHLFNNYHRLRGILREKAGGKKGKSAAASAAKDSVKTILPLHFVATLLKAIFHDDIPGHQEGLSLLRGSADLQRYIVAVAKDKLQQISDRGSCDGVGGKSREKIYTHCTNISRVLLRHYSSELQTPTEDQRERAKQLSFTCLEGFALTINIASSQFPERLKDFLATIDPSRDSGVGVDGDLSEQDVVHRHIKKLQRMIMTILTAEEEDHNQKEAVALVTSISDLSNHLEASGQQFAQVQSWAEKVCKEKSVADSGLVKSILSLFLTLTVRQKSCVMVLRDLAQDVHTFMGDIDQEVSMAQESNFAIVTPRTAAPSVWMLLLDQMDREGEDTDWVINRLKGELAGDSQKELDEENILTQKEAQEKNLFTRLGHMINTFHELVQTAAPVGPCLDHILRSLKRFYVTLTLLNKLYLAMYAQGVGHISGRFQKLVRLTGVNLTQLIYSLITYMQASQTDHIQQAAEKSRKKDKKVSAAVALAAKAKVLKDSKVIPDLIYNIEQYEKYVIQLASKSKVNLTEHLKASTSRDFRINVASLDQALEEQATSDDDSDDDSTQNESRRKRQRSGSEEESSSDEDQENEEPNANTSTARSQAPPAKKGKLQVMLGSKGKGKKSKKVK